MTVFSSQEFDSLFDRCSGATFEDFKFERCTFNNCAISLTKEVPRRAVVRNVWLEQCTSINCGIGPAIFEDVTVDGLTTNDLLILWGPLFKHVTLKGKIGKIKINTAVHHVDRSPEVQSPFDSAQKSFYGAVDWALDIQEASFQEFDMHGVPASLVRRDPATQVVVTRQRALQEGWRDKISPKNTYWPFVIDMFLEDEEPDIVLVAPKGKPKKKYIELLDGLNDLRQAGVVEPD